MWKILSRFEQFNYFFACPENTYSPLGRGHGGSSVRQPRHRTAEHGPLRGCIGYLEQQLATLEQLSTSTALVDKGRAFGNLGDCYDALGDSEEAIKCHEQVNHFAVSHGVELAFQTFCSMYAMTKVLTFPPFPAVPGYLTEDEKPSGPGAATAAWAARTTRWATWRRRWGATRSASSSLTSSTRPQPRVPRTGSGTHPLPAGKLRAGHILHGTPTQAGEVCIYDILTISILSALLIIVN